MTHIVLLKFTDQNDTAEAARRLNSMAGQIEGLTTLTAGPNVGPEGWHLGLVTTHPDAAALASYATDPVHLAVVEWLKPRIAERAVTDIA